MATDRKEVLREEIARLEERIAHLDSQARKAEAVTVEERHKFDAENTFTGREETHKVNFSNAVSYWREVREAEKRLDDLCAELEGLVAGDRPKPVDVNVRFDPPEETRHGNEGDDPGNVSGLTPAG